MLLSEFSVVVVVRMGEITIKGRRTRERFEHLLLRNMQDSLRSSGLRRYRIRRERGRFFVYADDEVEAVTALRRVFGIKSLSIADEIIFTDLEELVEKAENFFAEKVKGRSFAVRARRSGQHPFTSIDVERKLGEALLKYGSRVDLENPEVTAYVEVRGAHAYLYTDVVKAYGGLPIGSEGRVVALVSGGFDSPVAAWYMLRRGAEVHYVLCKLGGPVHEVGALHVLKVLADKWSYGYSPKLYVVDFRELVRDIREKCNLPLFNVILKRFMYRAADLVARELRAEAIVTGESLGQAASQTLRNLYVSSMAVRTQILRPLIGFDKDDIIAMAREIGTYEASARVKEYCGAFAEHPRTHASLEEVEAEEEKVEASLLEKAVREAKVYDLKSVSIEERSEDLELSWIPENAVIVDLRSGDKFGKWHIPGSLNLSFDRLVDEIGKLDPSTTYVLVCDEGALSLEAAYMLRKMGFKAFSLRGGIRKARRKLRAGSSMSRGEMGQL